MERVAVIPERAPAGEGGRFGVVAVEEPVPANPMVLTAREDVANGTSEDRCHDLEGVFQLEHPQLRGNLSVMPGRVDGARRIGLYMKGSGLAEGLRLDAELRSSWVATMCGDHGGRVERAAALAIAMVQLAAIPGQRTVRMTSDQADSDRLPDLTAYASLLGAKIIAAA